MNTREIRSAAKLPMAAKCKMCTVCNGKACAGQVPGMGGAGTGSSFTANVDALNAIRLNMRVLHEVAVPSTACELFGQSLSMPIMAAPMTGAVSNCGEAMEEQDFIRAIVEGSEQVGALAWVGDGGNPEFLKAGLEEIRKAGRGVAIVKPLADDRQVLERIAMCVDAGAVAVGMDVDAAGFAGVKNHCWPVSPKSSAQLEKIRSSTSLPFVVKGVMTVDEALICADTGVDCIVVSNHGGRVLDCCPGVAEVLPDIVKAAGHRLTIIADGGVRSGIDAFKLMALGAKGVLLGRPLCWGAYGAGAEGVAGILSNYLAEFIRAMIMTRCAQVNNISEDALF